MESNENMFHLFTQIETRRRGSACGFPFVLVIVLIVAMVIQQPV